MADIKGVLFDMDGLLLDTERLGQDAFVDATAPMGIPEAKARHAFLFMIGGNAEANHAALARELPEADPQVLRRDWVDAFEARVAKGVPLRPTAWDTVSALHARFPLVVVTSSIRRHAEHNLAATGLDQFFQSVVTAEDVTGMKPDPEPYRTGAARLGLDPRDCGAFEDSDVGITAAMGAGCQAVQIPDLRPPDRPLPALGQRTARTLAEGAALLGLLPVRAA
ncbi:MAG: HAD family phosphatase [Pseudomonadota bacterium]